VTAHSSATVHEAAGRLGAAGPRLKPIDPAWHLTGPAFTVLCEGGDNLWIHRGLYAAAPGDVLVVATAGEDEYGYWGEILAEAAIARGLAGLVIDGCVRDAAELRALGFPVFARGLTIRGTVKRPDARGALGVPVSLGGTIVAPGDLVVADVDGVAVVEQARADAVLAAADERVAKETELVRRIREGATTLDLLGLEAR
jgi:4-hydroxy-4-methyl-2-oxoglutarate aldolase